MESWAGPGNEAIFLVVPAELWHGYLRAAMNTFKLVMNIYWLATTKPTKWIEQQPGIKASASTTLRTELLNEFLHLFFKISKFFGRPFWRPNHACCCYGSSSLLRYPFSSNHDPSHNSSTPSHHHSFTLHLHTYTITYPQITLTQEQVAQVRVCTPIEACSPVKLY